VDAQLLDRKIYEGRAQAARRIGHECTIYRPVGNAWQMYLGSLKCALSTDGAYKRPALYGKPVWYGDLDGRQTRPGDYLERSIDGAIWFIAAQQSLLPIVMIECPRSVSLARQSAVTGVGAVSYSGVIAPSTLVTLWPASLLIASSGGPAVGLPGDSNEASWRALLPVTFPVEPESSDILTDDLGRRFEVTGAELTALGWRLSANELHA
jgi:hypothetical protein